VPDLEITGLTKTFDDHVALDAISLEANAGELLTLLGPSGCGKSTTLWSIAGLHRPDAGRISIGDRVVFDGVDKTFVPPEKRECGVVFQSYAIWPNMTVAENVGYPLGLRRIKGVAKEQRVREVLELVELGDLAKRYPHQLSGGQQQRVALARALASPPRLLLLDEPFSNLDAKLRDRARVWLKALQREIAVTTIFVTHDQDEALSLSDRVAVMSAGQIRQLGTPEEVYNAPADVFVADFVGTINLLDVTSATDRGDHVEVAVAGVPVALRVDTTDAEIRPADVGIIGFRPESVLVHESCAAGHHDGAVNTFDAQVLDVAYLGDHYRYRIDVGGTPVTVQTTHTVSHDGRLTVEIPPTRIRAYPHREPSDG
jgi:iron(III) transport system ATP-binding protein